MKAHTLRSAAVLAVAVLASMLPAVASANSTGVLNLTKLHVPGGGGCSGCHGAINTGLPVTISGPASVVPNSTVAYTITMSGIGAASHAGFNAAVSVHATQPTFQTGTGLAVGDSSRQVTHNPAKVPTAGAASWTVNLVVPAGASVGTTYTLYALANAGIGGDQVGWNHATNHTVTVAAALPNNPTGLQGVATSTSSTNLTWFGTAPEFRLMRKAGSFPTSPTDAGATNVYTGTAKTIPDTGLLPGTQYFYRVWGKATGSNTFSANYQEVTVTTYSPATTRHVNAGTGNDNAGANTCTSSGSPCRTITRAMAAANLGDTISVAPGTHNIALGEVFPINFKSGVQLIATGNPTNTIIDAAADTIKTGIIKAQGNNSANARIEGFTIANGQNFDLTGGCPTSLGGALYISGGVGTFTITRNVFRANEARGFSANGMAGGETGCIAWGGAMAVFSHTVNVSNNVFDSNIARGGNGLNEPGVPLSGNENGGQGQGGAIYFSGSGTIINNTFRGNSAFGGNGGTASNGTGNGGPGAGGAIMASGSPSVVNNIFSGNAANAGTGGTPETAEYGAMFVSGVAPSVSNNLFHGNTINGAASVGDTLGTASLASDPIFHSLAANNLRLRNSSPAKGTGTAAGAPATDHAGTTRPNPPSRGAYEASFVATSTALVSGTNPSNSGQSVTFTATVTGTGGVAPGGSVTFKDGATPVCSSVALSSGQAQCATSALAAGTRSITAEYAGDVNHSASTSSALSQVVNSANPPRLLNISTRMQVLTGNDVMIGGFVIGGASNKTVAIVATGPSLAPFGIANPLADPTLRLVRSSDQAVLATNDNWQSAGNSAQLQSAGLAPSHALEAAILTTLAPGAYTAIVEGAGGGTGVAVVAVYEVDAVTIPLINISTRGRVLTGNDVMIGGFVITGTGPQTVGIVATGPSLAPFGIANPLANPTLSLVRSSDQVVIDSNDDWQSHANSAQLQAAGLAPTNPLESGIYITLQPGAYTAILSGVGGGTGVGVIGVYKVN